MFQTLSLERFRGFRRFEMENLGRVNLLVGTNNSGKTSVLEGIEFLASRGNVNTLWSAMVRRGERVWTSEGATDSEVRHLFTGHSIQKGGRFSIRATTGSSIESVNVEISEISPSDPSQAASAHQTTLVPPEEALYPPLALKVLWQGRTKTEELFPLTARGDCLMRQFGSVESESLAARRMFNLFQLHRFLPRKSFSSFKK